MKRRVPHSAFFPDVNVVPHCSATVIGNTFRIFLFAVTMHKDKEDPHYRSRGELTAYDHTPLDGDMFLQVSKLQTENADDENRSALTQCFDKNLK